MPHRTLSGQLLLLVAALIACVGALVSGATAAAMGSYLTGQIDNSLSQSFVHELDNGTLIERLCPVGPGSQSGPPRGVIGQGAGALIVRPGCAFIVSADRIDTVPASVTDKLENVAADGRPHSVELPELGHYRVIQSEGLAIGAPLRSVDAALRNLILWEIALTLAGTLMAVLLARELIRRTLAPLRSVAATALAVTDEPLTEGDPSIATRVADELTDRTTEVGQVGSALNTLLSHVSQALSARHRSEQRARQFVADASHELRTPLATIQGYAELSRRTPKDSEALLAALDKVETEAHRMSAMVDDLLLLARLDSGRPLEDEDVDLTQVLLEAVDDARILSPGHRWKLALPDEPISVRGDSARIHQVITNLLSNARQHTPAGTEVTVGGSISDTIATVTVHDNGPGLPPDLVENAFERFSRGDSSRTRASGGAGLGLSLVAAIASALGGSVSVESKPGDTTFTVALPVAAA